MGITDTHVKAYQDGVREYLARTPGPVFSADMVKAGLEAYEAVKASQEKDA